jgi:hypothetical protein
VSSYGLVLPRPRVLPSSSLLRGSGVRALVSARAQIGKSSVRTGGSDTSAIAQLIAAAARQRSASATKNSTYLPVTSWIRPPAYDPMAEPS